MSEPAWKRLGLKIKETVENDPLGITKVNVIKKRKAEPGPNTEKKPPKRKKLPKNERPPPPEKDQLKYLRQYHEDRANWKFSKAKQTWILKNLKNIPQEYDEALKAYIASIQGGSRDRVRDEMMAVVDKWNNAARQALEDMQKEPEGAEESQEEKDEKDENAEANDDTKEKEEEKEEKKGAVDEDIPEYDFVMRAKALVEIITGEQVSVEGMAEESVKEGDKQDSDGQKDAEREHPMIVEEVDVQEYVGDEDEQLEVNVKSEGTVAVEETKEKQKTSKKTKKEKKAKKEKKDKSKEQA
ncbi:hypothetical protein KL928_005176 [Ogataea angusta]|uniref:WKF domain-containing protein n=1 Tax=Pichia angusta TaxID=870730 RepID=A0AAN6DB96_PICAN|nr:uncharacterized protein KL928_005176 [Ogataea angusta]KAG7815837.1 hypothetical protein KL928_005176 [Ogataea angusta]